MWTGYSVRILGVLTAAQILQHVALQSCLTALTVLAWCAPAKHRRWSPPLRLCLLFLSYCIPVVTDMTVFRAQAPAPSTVGGARWGSARTARALAQTSRHTHAARPSLTHAPAASLPVRVARRSCR